MGIQQRELWERVRGRSNSKKGSKRVRRGQAAPFIVGWAILAVAR